MGDKLKTTAKQVEEPWDATVRQHLGTTSGAKRKTTEKQMDTSERQLGDKVPSFPAPCRNPAHVAWIPHPASRD